MGGVFINYRERDEPYVAAGIYNDLLGRFGSGQVFRDSESLRPADHYPTVIREKLRSAEVVLAIIGPKWLELSDHETGTRLIDRDRDWVRAEIADALALRIPVIPVLLYDTKPPGKDDLPGDIAGLATAQACRVHYSSFTADVERLAGSIAELAPGVAVPQLFDRSANRPARWLPSALLRPEYGVVPLAGRESELANLQNWATGSDPVSIRLLVSPAGYGKTRLAHQLCRELEPAGWVVGFARESTPATAFDGTFRITRPLLIVIDDAEFRIHQVEAAAGMLARQRTARSAPRRVLLLSRHKDWLRRLYQHRDQQVADLVRAMREGLLGPLAAHPDSRAAEFGRAVQAFAAELGGPVPALAPPAELAALRSRSVLELHARALARVLDHHSAATTTAATTTAAPAGADHDPLARLRSHEYRFWARTAAGLDQTRLHIVAAVATLYGAQAEQQARTLLATLPQFRGPEYDRIESYLDWLRASYPGPSVLNPMEPARIGEDHLADSISTCPELVTAPAAAAGEQQISRAFVVLCRTAVRHPHIAGAITDLLDTDPDRLLPVAMSALRSCDNGHPLVQAMKPKLRAARPDTLMAFFEQLPVAGPPALALLYELSQAVIGKAAPRMEPDENHPSYKFVQGVNAFVENLLDGVAASFTGRDPAPDEKPRQRSVVDDLLPPDSLAILRELWIWRDKFPPAP